MQRHSIFLATLILGVNAENLNLPQNDSDSIDATQKISKESNMSIGDKSGFLLGVEANFGRNQFGRHFAFTPNPSIKVEPVQGVNWLWTSSADGAYMRSDRTHSSFAFDGGIKFGYQHYFTAEYGLRVSVYGGVGNPINIEMREKQEFKPEPVPGQPGGPKPDLQRPISGVPYIDYEALLQTSYLPIRFAVDIDFLYDFLERGKHTFGITAGVGYRFGYYLNQNGARFSGRAQDKYDPKNQQPPTYTNTMKELKMNNFATHDLYPQVGIHYYYGNHQFEFLLRASGFLRFNLLMQLKSGELRGSLSISEYESQQS